MTILITAAEETRTNDVEIKTSNNQRLAKCVRYLGRGRGYSGNLSMGCPARNLEFWAYSRGYSDGIWTSD